MNAAVLSRVNPLLLGAEERKRKVMIQAIKRYFKHRREIRAWYASLENPRLFD